MTRSMTLVLAALLAAPAGAQDPPVAASEKRPDELKTFINPDAKDTNTKLDLLIHTLYEVNQQLVNLQFAQRYGDRIRMEPADDPERREGPGAGLALHAR